MVGRSGHRPFGTPGVLASKWLGRPHPDLGSFHGKLQWLALRTTMLDIAGFRANDTPRTRGNTRSTIFQPPRIRGRCGFSEDVTRFFQLGGKHCPRVLSPFGRGSNLKG